MPASDGGDDFVRIGGRFEGFGLGIVMVEEPIDGGLQIGNLGTEVDPRAFAKQFASPRCRRT